MSGYRERYILPKEKLKQAPAKPVVEGRPQPASPATLDQGTSSGQAGGAVFPIVAGFILLMGVIIGFWAMQGRTEEATLPPPLAPTAAPRVVEVTPTSAPVTPTVDDTCARVASTYLTIIAELEAKNRWDQAAESATAALADERVCQDDRPVFAHKYVTDAMEGLYARPSDPSKAAQEEAVERYQTIRRQAQQYAQLYDVEVPRSLSVGQRASQSGAFLLVLAAYDEAWQRDFTAADVPIIKDYISNTYNVGHWWTQSPDSPTYAEGLAYLSTSYHLEQRYKTGQGDAYQRLRALLGDDPTIWPEPKKTPLLEGGIYGSEVSRPGRTRTHYA